MSARASLAASARAAVGDEKRDARSSSLKLIYVKAYTEKGR